MKIITSNRVEFRRMPNFFLGGYSSLDGNSTKAEIKAFQDWLDINQAKWLNGGILNKGKGYGTFGPSTSKAWNLYGSSYTKVLVSVNTEVSTPTLPITTPETPSTNPNLSTTSPTGQKKSGYLFDKALGGFVKMKDSGVLESIGAIFGKTLPSANEKPLQQTWDGIGTNPNLTPNQPTIDEKKKKRLTLIVVGGVLILGTIIVYLLSKKSPPQVIGTK